MPHQNAPLRSSERGASPVSVLILLTVILMFMELIMMGGRIAAAYGDVTGAAREGARQGSLVQTQGSLTGVVQRTVSDNLDASQRQCLTAKYSVKDSDFRPGGHVTVGVECEVDLTDMSLLGLPWPNKDFGAEATEIVETYRAVD